MGNIGIDGVRVCAGTFLTLMFCNKNLDNQTILKWLLHFITLIFFLYLQIYFRYCTNTLLYAYMGLKAG